VFVADMPNYYIETTGRYYFSGMYTAILPMIPGITAIIRFACSSHQADRIYVREPRHNDAPRGVAA
jgi:hypothetical protein